MKQKGNVEQSRHIDAVEGIVTMFLFIEKKRWELSDYLSQGLTVMRNENLLGVATHTWNPNTQEAEAGGPAWATEYSPAFKKEGRREGKD